ncbi:MAG: T9SS type A sorting domain-containing protein [Candidatus Zixiibacteriota bacterium]
MILIALVMCALSATAQAQPEPPYGLAQVSTDDKVTFYWFYPAVNESTIAAFDDKPVSYYFHSNADVGARLATAFALPGEVEAIASVDMFFWPSDPFTNLPGGTTTPFDLAIYGTFPQDEAVSAMWQKRTSNSRPGIKEWFNIPVRVDVRSDSAFVEFRWLNGTPTAPLPGVVYTDRFVNSHEGYLRDGLLVWQQIYDSAVLMRLHVARSDLGGPASSSATMPDSFCVYVLDSPEEAGGQIQVEPVRDSLHLTFERGDVEGKFITVVACEGGLVSAKSEMIEVDVATKVEAEDGEILPVTLMQNYPNPFNSETTICAVNSANIDIYDLLGRKVRSLRALEKGSDGVWCISWDGRNELGATLPSGVYFYRQSGQAEVRKLILLK